MPVCVCPQPVTLLLKVMGRNRYLETFVFLEMFARVEIANCLLQPSHAQNYLMQKV